MDDSMTTNLWQLTSRPLWSKAWWCLAAAWMFSGMALHSDLFLGLFERGWKILPEKRHTSPMSSDTATWVWVRPHSRITSNGQTLSPYHKRSRMKSKTAETMEVDLTTNRGTKSISIVSTLTFLGQTLFDRVDTPLVSSHLLVRIL